MFFPVIFHSKIIDCEGELNGSCDRLPEARCVWDLVVLKRLQALLEELVS